MRKSQFTGTARELLIHDHLERNVHPPFGFGDHGAVEFAAKAIEAVAGGEPDRQIEVTGAGGSVWQGIAGRVYEEWKLEGFE